MRIPCVFPNAQTHKNPQPNKNGLANWQIRFFLGVTFASRHPSTTVRGKFSPHCPPLISRF